MSVEHWCSDTDRGNQRDSVTNLSQCPFVHHKPTLTCLGLNWDPGDPEFKQTDNKVKAVPLQAWSGPEGSRKLRFPDFMTTAQDGGEVVSLTHRPPLPPGSIPGTHFC